MVSFHLMLPTSRLAGHHALFSCYSHLWLVLLIRLPLEDTVFQETLTCPAVKTSMAGYSSVSRKGTGPFPDPALHGTFLHAIDNVRGSVNPPRLFNCQYRHQKAGLMLEIRRFRVRGSRLDFPHMLTCERSSPEQTS